MVTIRSGTVALNIQRNPEKNTNFPPSEQRLLKLGSRNRYQVIDVMVSRTREGKPSRFDLRLGIVLKMQMKDRYNHY